LKNKYFFHLLLLLLLVFFTGGCNVMKKNTSLSRSIYDINTRFNVYFNGKVSYEDGLKAISQSAKDDYSQIIPMYPVSMHENAKSASSQMVRTIEKCRKAIKTKSFKLKPRLTRKQQLDPKYRNFLKQEEYNPFMPEVWLLLAQAEFHKADFLGAIGTFNYIKRHFPENKELGITCQLWIIRSYAELDWLYEAEEMFSKIDQKELYGDNLAYYTAFYADLLLKKKQFSDAIPYLELALQKEKTKQLRLRFSFLLAQLYAHTGDKKASTAAYENVIKMNPPYELAFNARIGKASLFDGSMQDTRRDLNKMIKNPNNKDYLDQLFHLRGKSYLLEKDTVRALADFKIAADSSSRKGTDMAAVLVTTGDLYYKMKDYVKAQPCYDEASKIYTVDFYDYKRISSRAEMLSELVMEHEIVMLQDSLQRLSAMTPDERLKTIELYIAKLEAAEKLAAEQEALKAKSNENGGINGPEEGDAFDTPGSTNQFRQMGDWYFYNPGLVKGGQIEFQKKWGKRKLEDNWRRQNKSAVLFAENENTESAGITPVAGDSINASEEGDPIASGEITDTKNPEYYLRQIPVTPAQLEKSDEIRGEALFKMANIYQDKLEDYPMAINAFADYFTRYPKYENAADAVYFSYLLRVKTAANVQAEVLRNKLIADYPENKYAQLLVNPEYLNVKKQMFVEQDSVYSRAYIAFNKNDFNELNQLATYMETKYPLSPLMPRFKFLKALSVGRTSTRDEFEKELTSIVDNYPESEVTSISKDMLALIKQGRENQAGTTHGSILSRREEMNIQENDSTVAGLSFSPDDGPYRLVLLGGSDEKALYPLQFKLAVYNFSKFLLKDFEMNIASLGKSGMALSVLTFENREEAQWYLNTIKEEKDIQQLIKELNVSEMFISEFNYSLLKSGFSLDEYLLFATENNHVKK
jgi:tetratricopeptide (TPR) repeat protein